MKIVFMGTPDFAVPSLKMLLDKGYDVPLVITQPDKPRGRGKKISFTPIKEYAIKKNINVIQPERIKKNTELIEKLNDINPDLIVVTAYGKILPEEMLKLPKYGCINVHASLLPKYRGAAPINWVLINGENETGISTIIMEKGLDTGDILMQCSIPISDDDNAITLHDKLSELGGKVLIKTINKLLDNTINPQKQNDENATYAPIIEKSLGLIDWRMSAKDIRNRVRGLIPWPGTYTFYEEDLIKIWDAIAIDNVDDAEPGEVLESKNDLIIKCGSGALKVLEIQSGGTRKMRIEDYLRGHNIIKGVVLKEK